MAPAPNAFSNELGKWICQEFRGSILFVELTPRDPAAVKSLWDKITPIPEEDEEQQLERVKESQKIRCSTGFIIKDADGYIQVLTCAHVMGDLFKAANPITARRLGQLFSFRVLCDHREMRFKRREDQSRVFCNARVNRISCQKDLLLLSVTRQHFEGYCNQPHQVLSIAPAPPSSLERVAMLSWPPNRYRTSVTGEHSYSGRLFNHVSKNPSGFGMKIADYQDYRWASVFLLCLAVTTVQPSDKLIPSAAVIDRDSFCSVVVRLVWVPACSKVSSQVTKTSCHADMF